jgi:hypothetical protein
VLDDLSHRGIRRSTWWLADRMDRGPVWGSIQILPDRFGGVRYRLTVYPPGTDAATRRWLHIRAAWSHAGLVCAAGSAMILMPVLSPALAAAVIGLGYLIGWLVVASHSASAARDTRRLLGVDWRQYSLPGEAEGSARIRRLTSTMIEADRSLHAGLLSPVAHEVIWENVFNEMEGARIPRKRLRA